MTFKMAISLATPSSTVRVDLTAAKAGFRALFPPGHPARLALDAQPDEIDKGTFDALYPVLVRLAGVRTDADIPMRIQLPKSRPDAVGAARGLEEPCSRPLGQ